jgi:hypothetical protein
MRNTVSLFKQYPPGEDVSSTWRPFAVLAALLVSTSIPPGLGIQAAGQPVPGTSAPALARLFTPRQAPEGVYGVTVLDGGIDEALRTVKNALAPDAKPGQPAGSWQVQHLDPLEAFGTTGIYDRSKVARLYVGRRASVVRGPVEHGGKVVAAVTLISPYPDATLSRLEAGTMVIMLKLAGR